MTESGRQGSHQRAVRGGASSDEGREKGALDRLRPRQRMLTARRPRRREMAAWGGRASGVAAEQSGGHGCRQRDASRPASNLLRGREKVL